MERTIRYQMRIDSLLDHMLDLIEDKSKPLDEVEKEINRLKALADKPEFSDDMDDEMSYSRNIPYNPEMCEKTIAILSDGGSLKQVAKALGVDMETLIEWRIFNPLFDGAIEAGLISAKERMTR